MKTLHLSFIIFIMIIFLTFGICQAHADNVNGVYVQNIKIQPSAVKVGDAFTVTITLVNNSTFPIWLDGGKCSSADTHASFFTVTFDNHAKIKAKDINCAGVGWSQMLDPGKNITSTIPDYTVTYIATDSGIANATMTFSYHVINQTDPAQPGFSQNISKSFLFTIYGNNSGVKAVNETPLSPLEQFKSGVNPYYVICRKDLQLLTKAEDGSPACVKSDSIGRLLKQGWVNPYDSNGPQPLMRDPSTIQVTATDLTVTYKITGGQLEEAKPNIQNKELILLLKTTGKGALVVDLPRSLIDNVKNGQDSPFVVLEDGITANFQELEATATDRGLIIPFQYGVSQIEIVATEPVQ
jgi:hypothetical protein